MRQKVVEEARSWLNTAFRHQGRIKASRGSSGACDCLGLIIGVSKSLNLKTWYGKLFHLLDYTQYSSIPDGEKLVSELDKHLIRVEQPRAGDLALLSFLGQPQHLAIIGDQGRHCNERGSTSSSRRSVRNCSNLIRHIEYLTLIHAYATIGKVCEHIFDRKWQRRAVAFYCFSF